MIVYDKNGYLVVGGLKFKPKPEETIIVEKFHFSGDHILEYGILKRRASKDPRLEIENNTFVKYKYHVCG